MKDNWKVWVVLAAFMLCLAAGTAEAVGLAIGIRPIYADDKNRLELPDTAGCIVVVVQKGGTGDLVGLRIGDVVRTFNDEPVQNVQSFLLQSQQAPTVRSIGVWRDGKLQSLTGLGVAAPAGSAGTGLAAPERAQPLEGFLGMPWNTAPQDVRQQLQSRGGFVFDSASGTEKELYSLTFKGTFAGRPAELVFGFSGGSLYKGVAIMRSPVDDVLKNYEALLADINAKYGPPNRRTGKYLDQKTQWMFPAGNEAPNSIVMEIQRLSGAAAAVFFIRIDYTYGVAQKVLDDKKLNQNKKDL